MVATKNLVLVDDKSRSYMTSNNEMGVISDMLSWNLRYPVKDREQRRNSGAEYLQGNRNPFIDHPEYACKIWGGYNQATRQVCGGN
jgi:endonuclease I